MSVPVCERERVNSVVKTVIVWIGNVVGVCMELGKANGGKRAVVASVQGLLIRLIRAVCEGRSEKPRGSVSEIAKPIHI